MRELRPVRLLTALLLAAACMLVVAQAAYAVGEPVLLTPPTISGSAVQGQTVSCSQGTWNPLFPPTSYSYTWQNNGSNIGGQTGSSYMLTSADVNQLITCTVVASNAAGSSLVPGISPPIIPIASLPVGLPVNEPGSPPSISGSAQQGQTVTCSPGAWANSPISYSYTWQNDGSNIGGQTGSTYTLTSADVNQLITCTVVASNASGSSLPAISAPITPTSLPVGPVPLVTTLPSISGSAQQGQTVTCSPGAWANSPTSYSYTWQNDLSNISGATSSTYTLTSADVNQLITCTVVASNASGNSLPAPSAPITPLALPVGLVPISTSPPSISGTAQQGHVVTCSSGAWTNGPTSYSYAWLRTGMAISGATTSQYTLTSSDVNQAVTCEVVAHNAVGDSAPALAVPIVPSAGSNPPPPPPPPSGAVPVNSAAPAISGTGQPGHTVTCSPGTWSNSPTGYSYSWGRNYSLIAQGSNQYTLTSADVGKKINCVVVAKNAAGNSSPAISPALIPTAAGAVPVATAAPTISGGGQPGQTVTCHPGSWSNSPTSYSYSWGRNYNLIAQGKSQYTLTSADIGRKIMCVVVARNATGPSAPAVSAGIVPVSGPKLRAPSLSVFSVSPSRIVVLVAGKHRRTRGATFRYRLDQSAGVMVLLQRRTTGRLVGGRCVNATSRNRKSGRCTRYIRIQVIRVKSVKAGLNKLGYGARIGKRLLGAGSYRASIAAINRGGWSRVRSAAFTVVLKPAGPARRR